jgi:DNA polymerase-3 subunit delta'
VPQVFTELADPEATLAGIEPHAHARAVLLPALPPTGVPSHAYLFYGPPGTGKRTVARAFAAALLTDGARQPATVAERVERGAHPDLTWVTPSGSSEVLVGDIDEAVVAAVTHTPFESTRRVFVIEAAGTMNDQAANRLLKTLEEPPTFAHLILLAEHREDVLPTIASRCQQVRFDPLTDELLQRRLVEAAGAAIDSQQAAACARLAQGDARLAWRLTSEQGVALREWAEAFVRSTFDVGAGGRRWMELLETAKAAGAEAGGAATERLQEQAELLPSKERRKYEREGVEVVRRAERRARTATLDLGLRLVELWLRDLWCIAVGASELVFALDRSAELAADVEGCEANSLLRSVELVRDTRLRLALNVSEELAIEALAYRLADLRLGPDSAQGQRSQMP